MISAFTNGFRAAVFLVILVLSGFTGHSQSPRLTLYGEDEGLNRMSIHDIIRGPFGYLWLATEKGIVRFDGSNFIEFLPDNGTLSNQEVIRLRLSGSNLYVVYRDSGLFCFNTENCTSYTITRQPVADVTSGTDNTLFYTTKNGQLVKLLSGKEVKRRIFRHHRESLIRMHYGKLVANFPRLGMYLIDPMTLNIERKLDFLSEGGDFEFFKTIDDTLFYLARDSAFRIGTGLNQNYKTTIYTAAIPDVSNLIESSTRVKFMIAQRKNLFKSSNNGIRQIPINGFKNLELKNILTLDDDNIFIGTNQGLLKIRLKTEGNRTIDDNIVHSQTTLRIRRKILETDDGKLILTGHPLCYLNRNDTSFIPIADSSYSVFDAALVGDDVFLATEDNGFKRVNLSTRKIQDIPITPPNKSPCYTAIEIDSRTGDFFIGGIGMLIRYNPTNHRTSYFNLPERNTWVRYIFIDYLFNRIWMGTEKGLYYTRYNPDQTSLFPRFTKLSGEIIGDLKLRRGTQELWVGHNKGVEVIDLKTMNIVHKVPLETFYNPRTTGILEDKLGRMWFSTYQGIVGYQPGNGKFVRLNKKNNLLNLEFNYKACIERKNGELVFGGLNGYDVIKPEKYQFGQIEKSGTITGIQIFSDEDTTIQMLQPNDKNQISFNTDKEHLRIYLSAENLASADQYNYQFKLDDGAWTTANKQSHIKIIKLDPGEYTLRLRAFNEFGIPIEFDTITLKAEQEFLKSRAFLGFLTFLSFASLFSVIAVFRNSRKKERMLKESIAMDLHDEVGTILTRTLYIQNQTKPEDPLRTYIPKYLNEALFSLRVYIQTMNKQDFSLYTLRDEIHDIAITTFAPSAIKLDFKSRMNLDLKLNAQLYRDIKLCMYELTNNILKHAQTEECKLEISLSKGILSIMLEDNGCLKDIEKIENKGNGINNLRKRIERNAGTLNLSISGSGNGLVSLLSFKLKS